VEKFENAIINNGRMLLVEGRKKLSAAELDLAFRSQKLTFVADVEAHLAAHRQACQLQGLEGRKASPDRPWNDVLDGRGHSIALAFRQIHRAERCVPPHVFILKRELSA